MDPISAGLMVAGLAMQTFGSFSAAGHAKEAAGINQQIAADEGKINEQKRTQMELQARRQQMEIFRNSQRLRAQATAAAVNQGATMGSGLAGGLSQITDQTTDQSLALGQNLQIGQNIFGFNEDISQQKQKLSSVQGEVATDQAIASLGGSMVKLGPTIGGLAKDYTAGFGFGGSSGGDPGMSSPYLNMPMASYTNKNLYGPGF